MSTNRRKGGRRAHGPRRSKRQGSARAVRAPPTLKAKRRTRDRRAAARRPHRPSRARARTARRPPSRSHRRPAAKSRPGTAPARRNNPKTRPAPPAPFLPRGSTPIVLMSSRQTPARTGPVSVRPGATERGTGLPATLGNGPGAALARPGSGPVRVQPIPPTGTPARPASMSQTFRPLASSASPAATSDRRPARRPVLAPRKRDVCAMILAAGQGKRMLSQSSKLVHNVAGRPMVRHVVEAARAAGMARTVVVVGNQADEVRRRSARTTSGSASPSRMRRKAPATRSCPPRGTSPVMRETSSS